MDNWIKAIIKDRTSSVDKVEGAVNLDVQFRYNSFYQEDQVSFTRIPAQFTKGYVVFHYRNSGKERAVNFNDWISLEGEIDPSLGKTILVVEKKQ